MKPVNKGVRLVHFIVDMLIIIIISKLLEALGVHSDIRFIILIVFLTYYFAMEWLTGRTFGKMITKTMVVDSHNSKPGILRILLRTLLRLNPFDAYSYLFGSEIGAHDSLSKTWIVKRVGDL